MTLRKVNIIFFVFLLLFGITGIFLQIFVPGWNAQPGIPGVYLQLPFVLAVVLLAIIGFRRNIRNEFLKSLLHGYVILLIFLASACVVLAIVHGGNLNCFQFLNLVFIYVCWSVLIFLFPMSVALFFIRKVKSKKYRRIGYAMVIIVFGTVFHICHYIILGEIGGAMGAGAMIGV
jgi:hypothetical protein